MRRHFLVEKAKNAAIIGILVGTLGVAGYLGVIERLRQLARDAGKKTYTMMMGKPNPQKLANFAEVLPRPLLCSASLEMSTIAYVRPLVLPAFVHHPHRHPRQHHQRHPNHNLGRISGPTFEQTPTNRLAQ